MPSYLYIARSCKETFLNQKFNKNCNLVANERLINFVNESQVMPLEKSLSKKN